jgi:hypothetical protein
MKDKELASRIRQLISKKLKERQFIEQSLLKHREMIAACLIARHLGSSREKRKTPSYYLSGKVFGKTVLRHVKKENLEHIRKRAAAWREFSSSIAGWRKLNNEIEKLFRKLGKVQSEEPFKKDTSNG